MANTKNIFKGILPKDKKQWQVFLSCLLVSTLLWSLLKFSEKRDDHLEVDLNFFNFPKNEMLIGKIPKSISVTIQAQGFELISKSFGFRSPSIDINVAELMKVKRGTEYHYVWLPKQHTIEISSAIGSKLKDIETPASIDTIRLVYSEIVEKDLLTGFNYEITQAKEHFVLKEPLVSPYKVTVRGAKSKLIKLDSIYTERTLIDILETDLDQDYKLKRPIGVDSIYVDSVRVFLGVEALKEHQYEVPIQILDAPDSLEFKLFPSEVVVTFTCGMSDLAKFSPNDFKAQVNFEDIRSSFKRLNVSLDKAPDIVKNIKVEPASVEYIVKSKD